MHPPQRRTETVLTTLFMLVYGDYFAMHKKAISPLLRQDPEKVSVRLWLNAVCLETFEWLLQNAPKHWLLYVSSQNPPKYPIMRKLFNDPGNPIETPWVTWLDDDTNIACDDWLAKTEEFITETPTAVFFGAQYWKKHLSGVTQWVRHADWFAQRSFMRRDTQRRRVERGTGIAFLRGSYWWIKLPVIRALDWPDKRLKHNGGDTALSEAIWQLKLPQHKFSYGIAGELAPRRGRSEKPAGFKYKLINDTDGSVAAMLGQMEQYELRLTQADVPFIRLNGSTLLVGSSAEYADSEWLEPVGKKEPVATKKPAPRPKPPKPPKPLAPAPTGSTLRRRLEERRRRRERRRGSGPPTNKEVLNTRRGRNGK